MLFDLLYLFVIDEYPYLAKAKPAISAMLQHAIDHKWTESRMYLILCGSSMSFMENQVLGRESPLYGRRTGQFKIEQRLCSTRICLLKKVGEDTSVVSKYLKTLMDLGIVRKETPITEKPGKKTIYLLADNFFRFWYRFVPVNMNAIDSGRIAKIYPYYYYIFSKSGFTDGLLQAQERGEVRLRTLDDLY